jgi:DNA modification methylase
MNIETVPIDSLIADPANVRKHPDRNLDAIKASLARFGQQKPLVVDGNNVVRAGNGTLAAARSLGWTEINIVRTALVGSDAVAFAIADNRTSDLSAFESEDLARILKEMDPDLSIAAGFDEDERATLLSQSILYGGPKQLDDPGEVEPPATPASIPGDLWVLGDHRLLCGDSTKPDDLARLLDGEKAGLFSTDPPYCMDYTGNDRPIDDGRASGKDWSHVYREVDIKDLGEFLDAVFRAALPHVVDEAAIYIWHDHLQYPVIAATFEKHGLLLHQSLIWVKPVATFGHSYYRWRHEPCAFGWKRGFKPKSGYGDMESVWEVDWEGKARVSGNEHPTQKPTKLFEIPMEQHTAPGSIVLEPFSGSGSQIIAAEKLSRKCYAMEISPAFVDAGVRRWQQATGRPAILESTGQLYDQVCVERGATAVPQVARPGDVAVQTATGPAP